MQSIALPQLKSISHEANWVRLQATSKTKLHGAHGNIPGEQLLHPDKDIEKCHQTGTSPCHPAWFSSKWTESSGKHQNSWYFLAILGSTSGGVAVWSTAPASSSCSSVIVAQVVRCSITALGLPFTCLVWVRIEWTGGVELIDLIYIYRQYGSSDLIRVVTVGESSVITYHILILSSLILFCLCPWFPLCFRVVQFYSIDQSRCIQLFYCPWPFIFVDLNSPFSKGVVCILHRSLTSQRSHLSNDASADQLNNYFGTRSKWI